MLTLIRTTRAAAVAATFFLPAILSAGADEKIPGEASPPESKRFVQVSEKDCRYFQYDDGAPFIPVGPNIPWSRTTTEPGELLKQYEHYFSELAANGGNFTRIWLSAPHWELEHRQAGQYDLEKKGRVLDGLLALAARHGIKIKFCIENFRQLLNRPAPFEGSVAFDKPIYHPDHGGPVRTMDEYLHSEAGRSLYLGKLRFLSEHYRDNPSVFGWELWNEMNSIRSAHKPEDIFEWTETMLAEAKKLFPRHLVMQSLGSFDTDTKRAFYKSFSLLEGNQVAQIHRYLDPGEKKLPVVHGPMDLLAADATRELLSYGLNKPAVVSEVGAVEANHAGPSRLYDVDTGGVLLHDLLFAPFFSGAAGPGQGWHWHHYIDKNDLWWHFGRFTEAIKGIDPPAEDFAPFFCLSGQMRIYGLKGRHTTISWLRDTQSGWQSELVDRKPTQAIEGLTIDLAELGISPDRTEIECYLPWENRWVQPERQKNSLKLPTFTRSIVLRAK